MPNESQTIARIFEYYEQEINYDQLKCDFFKLVSLGNIDKLKSFLQKNERKVKIFARLFLYSLILARVVLV